MDGELFWIHGKSAHTWYIQHRRSLFWKQNSAICCLLRLSYTQQKSIIVYYGISKISVLFYSCSGTKTITLVSETSVSRALERIPNLKQLISSISAGGVTRRFIKDPIFRSTFCFTLPPLLESPTQYDFLSFFPEPQLINFFCYVEILMFEVYICFLL